MTMKKIALIAAATGIFLFQSCSEVAPKINGINTEDGAATAGDTAYTTTVETPQAKKVLAEEFTGVSCPPCPGAAKLMRSIREQLNGDLVVVAYHILNYPQSSPVEKNGELLSKYDFRTQDATDVGASIYGGIGALPSGGFDRSPLNNTILLNQGNWSNVAQKRLGEEAPVNIHITPTYDQTTREATIRVKLAYTQAVTIKENLTVAIVEDSIIDAQKDGLDIVKEYLHEHVLRDIITPTIGIAIPPMVEPKEPGRVFETSFKVTINEDWHAEHCHIVAFVNRDDPSDRTVVQAAEEKLMGE